jgi:23S rRNA pseudouridine1911/1915/1917 synthase
MNIKILFEDKDLLVINKPAGISVHSDGKTREKTIADWILEKYPKIKNVVEPLLVDGKEGKKIKILRPGIVHRLDKETSGVLIIAKNQKTFEFFKKQFSKHTIKKIYQTFVYGSVSDPRASLATNKRGVINVSIGRSPLDVRMWTAGRGARPPLREAITEYIILKKFKEKGENFSYLEVYPKTGRTHQIRVHLRYINHPIVSDPLYRGTKDLALGMKRLALHAKSITFQLINGETKTIEAPYPADFKKVMDKYIK